MEGGNETHSSGIENGLWISPEDMPPSPRMSRQDGETSTPNLSVWPKLRSLEFSAGSSKQDSGYFSQTPRSGDSSEEAFDGKCNSCCKLNNRSFGQSTPEIMTCSCKKSMCENQLPDFEFLPTISENNGSKEPILSRIRISRASDFFDEAMDTSLYPDEMEVDNNLSGENHFSLGLTDIGEEKSIDFIESGICLSSTIPSETRKVKEILRQSDVLQRETEEFFSPEPDVFKCDEVYREVKESSSTKVRKSNNFHTTAKKITVINKVIKSFSLNGIDRIDFLYQLCIKKNFPHIVNKILSYLSEKDLDCVRVVSKGWNEVFNNDFPAYSRWKLYRTTFFMRKENLTSPKKTGSSGGRSNGRPMPLSPMHVNVNHQFESRRGSPLQLSPPVSPKSARFRSFQKAAKGLKGEQERVLQCPKCYFASLDHGSPYAQCCRSGCRHHFCVWCRNEVKTGVNHVCPPLYTPRLRRDAHKIPSIGSKICRRNLRRL